MGKLSILSSRSGLSKRHRRVAPNSPPVHPGWFGPVQSPRLSLWMALQFRFPPSGLGGFPFWAARSGRRAGEISSPCRNLYLSTLKYLVIARLASCARPFAAANQDQIRVCCHLVRFCGQGPGLQPPSPTGARLRDRTKQVTAQRSQRYVAPYF